MLALRYFGSVGYYVAALRGGEAARGVVCGALFDKRHKEVHRCTIADTRGLTRLTVPIVHPHGVERARWDQVGISSHGHWWHIHRQSLEAAYGRTPFFEFYIDQFAPYLCEEVVERCGTIARLDMALDAIIRHILLLPPAIPLPYPAEGEPINPDIPASELPEYYQVRAVEQGFHPGLSILDLIFNLGPEAALYIRNS